MYGSNIDQLLSLLYQADQIHQWHVVAAIGFSAVGQELAKKTPPFVRILVALGFIAIYVSLSMYVNQLGKYYLFIYQDIFGSNKATPFYRSGFWKSWIILGVSTAYILALMAVFERRHRKKTEPDSKMLVEPPSPKQSSPLTRSLSQQKGEKIVPIKAKPKKDNKLANLLTVVFLFIYRFFSVPQGYCRVVTAFGKYVRVSKPGLRGCLSFWGFYRKPGKLIPTMEQILHYEGEKVFTSDGVECIIDTVAFFRIHDFFKAVYEVEDYEAGIEILIQTILRSGCGDLLARDLLPSRNKLAEQLRNQLEVDCEPWGISFRLVEIKIVKIINKASLKGRND